MQKGGEGGSTFPEGAGLTEAQAPAPSYLGSPPGSPSCHGPPSALRLHAASPPRAPRAPRSPSRFGKDSPQERDFKALLPHAARVGPRLSLAPPPRCCPGCGYREHSPSLWPTAVSSPEVSCHCHPGRGYLCPEISHLHGSHTGRRPPSLAVSSLSSRRPCAQGLHGFSARVGLRSEGLFPKGSLRTGAA